MSPLNVARVNLIINNPKKLNGKSKFRGVCKRNKKWEAKIRHMENHYRIGLFATEEEAALAYNKKALELKGVKAKLNIIHG